MYLSNAGACIGANGKPRKCYGDELSADIAAQHVLATHRKTVVSYSCRGCGAWHLTPKERYTPSHFCGQCGKKAYDAEHFAQLRAELREHEGAGPLRVYECPYGDGWHLTSRR